MQQATYRSRRADGEGTSTRQLINLLIGELAALASMVIAVTGSLLIAASYLI